MATGVTPQGFVPKTQVNLLQDVEQSELANIDPLLDTSAEEPIGQLNGIFTNDAADLWELGGVAYNGMNPDAAEGPQLDNICALTGTKRKGASPSFTLQTCTFSIASTYTSGSLVANVVGQSSVQFANGDDIAVVTTGGTTTATDLRTGQVLATGSLPLTVPNIKFFCTVDGPTIAAAGNLNTISSPVTGWTSTTNPTDAVLGTTVEGDTALRIRREEEIAAVGSGNPDAVQADIDQVPGVIKAIILENTTGTTDSNGTPPHSYQPVIWDGVGMAAANNDIAQALWNDKPTGITPYGLLSGTAIDSNGNPRTMLFNRATQLTLYMNFTVTLAANAAPIATLAPIIKQAIVDATNGIGVDELAPQILTIGSTVYSLAMKAAALTVAGVVNVPLLNLGFTASPSGTADLTTTSTQIPVADTSRILVNGI